VLFCLGGSTHLQNNSLKIVSRFGLLYRLTKHLADNEQEAHVTSYVSRNDKKKFE
jgi:hypothetical protein